LSFVAGETFLFPLGGDQTPHLWIVTTTPESDGLFAIVSLTSLKGSKDQTVILRSGEHPFIRWDTCVAYALADLTSSEKLQDLLDRGIAERRGPLRRDLPDLVVPGFSASPFTKKRINDFVRAARR
jgi:hypothetical protein